MNGQTAWAVGYDYLSNDAAIVHTTNGTNWSLQFSNSLGHLWNASFVNADTGWVVGIDRNILNTTDGGETWTEQISDYLYPRCVQFIGSNTGWIACDDGIVLHSANAGMAWDTLTISTDSYPEGMYFLNAQQGFVCGSGGTIFRTSDGGQNWIRRGSGTEVYLNGVCFADTSQGWAVGNNNTILHTTNGGSDWTPQSSGVPYGFWCGAYFADALHGWICGAGTLGPILATQNGGDSWQVQPSDAQSLLEQITFCDASDGWAVGLEGTIVHTTDGGASWQSQESPQSLDIYGVACTDPQHAWAVCHQTSGLYNGYVLHTTDGGDNWTVQTMLPYAYIFGIAMPTDLTGWICGISAQTGRATLWHTTDGGQNWSAYTTGYSTVLLNVKTAGQTALTVSANGLILRSRDGGSTWMADTSNTDNQLWGLALAGPDHAWAVGDGGTILRAITPPLAADNRPSPYPLSFSLSAYPNPFNPVSVLELTLPRTERVRIAIYDLSGRLVSLLADRVFAAGTGRVTFDGSHLASGVYFARAESEGFVRTQRLLLLK